MAPSRAPFEPQRLLELLAAMQGRRIAIIGDLMLDRYLIGDSDRISPEAPVPVVAVRERRDGPGGAANVAANVVALGGHAMLLGVIGEDAEAMRSGRPSWRTGFCSVVCFRCRTAVLL